MELQVQNRSAPPQVVSAAAAIRRLRHVKFTSAAEAIEELATWQDSSRILQLYQRYFPQEFARSAAGTVIPRQGRECRYSEREIEFMGLVDRHLFPLPDMMFDMERLPSVPIYPHIVKFAVR